MHIRRLFLFLSLAPAVQPCEYFREFPVDNCTACPTIDENRPGVKMAVCETRYKNAGEMAYACVCGSFPLTLEPALQYYPQIEGNLTKCAESWVAAPAVFTTLTVVYVALMLYALAHVFYIIALSRICCCNSDGCTKNNCSALSLAVGWLFHVVLKMWRIATQGEIAVGHSSAEQHAWLAHGFAFLQTGYYVCLFLAIPFYITSIFEMVCPGKRRAVRRCIVNATLWFLAFVTGLSYIVMFNVSLQSNADNLIQGTARICGLVISISCMISFLVANVLMYLAFRSMREVRLHAAPCVIQCALVSFLSKHTFVGGA